MSRFDLASAFRLDGRYTSNIMSVLSYLMEYARIVGMTSNVAYSSNVFEDRGGRLFTSAAPSMMMTSACGSLSGSVM